jgi:murein DD-endopeptidase MepM/ murein hydrolase activator NlpD
MLQGPLSNPTNNPDAAFRRATRFIFDPKVPLISVLVVGLLMVILLSHVKAEFTEIYDAPVDESVFISPYDDYVITQGLHGFSYGHMAVDIAAGKGAEIKSPINGEVTANYVDHLGNTTLVIENKLYKVTLLHGIYKVSIGDVLSAGQVVGTESNQGYTTDMQGRSCRNRECGYHTHLNVFHKRKKTNVNPLDLISR